MLTIVTVLGSGSRAWAQGPGNGVAAQIAALQAQVSTLSSQVTALQNAIGAANVWQNASDDSASVVVPKNDAAVSPDISTWNVVTLGSLSLPAGSYLLEAKSSIQNTERESLIFCKLVRAGDPTTEIDVSFDYTANTSVPTIVKVLGVATLPSADTVSFQCAAGGDPSDPRNAYSFGAKLVAIQASLQ